MTLQAIVEIVIMLLGAAVCGFILAWLLFRNTKEEAERLRNETALLLLENKKLKETAQGFSSEKAAWQQQATQLRNEKEASVAQLQGEKDALAAQLQACRAEHDRMDRQTTALREQLQQCEQEKSSMSVAAAPVARGLMATAPEIKPDDLKIVEGIGPKIEKLFHQAGILTYLQLAEAPIERLQQILDEAGPRYQMHNPATWPRQSKMAHEGQWEALKAYQDELDGGRA